MDDGVVFVGRSNSLNGKAQPSNDFSKMFTRLGALAAKSNNGTAPAAVPQGSPVK
jgi:hypothetical protein